VTDLAVLTCPSCGAPHGGEDVCETCGARLHAAPAVPEAPELPTSRFARLAVIFATLPFGVNVLSNLLGRFFDERVVEASSQTAYAVAWLAFLVFFVVTRVLVVALVGLSFYNGRKALREIRTGAFKGRGRVIASFVIGAALVTLVVVSIVSLVVGLLVPATSV
jgi:hypothetical protein